MKIIKNGCELRLVAGLDTDGIAKLFLSDGLGLCQPVRHKDWLEVLDKFQASPGELLDVRLGRIVLTPT